jgi:hypothetical protein
VKKSFMGRVVFFFFLISMGRVLGLLLEIITKLSVDILLIILSFSACHITRCLIVTNICNNGGDLNFLLHLE